VGFSPSLYATKIQLVIHISILEKLELLISESQMTRAKTDALTSLEIRFANLKFAQ